MLEDVGRPALRAESERFAQGELGKTRALPLLRLPQDLFKLRGYRGQDPLLRSLQIRFLRKDPDLVLLDIPLELKVSPSFPHTSRSAWRYSLLTSSRRSNTLSSSLTALTCSEVPCLALSTLSELISTRSS